MSLNELLTNVGPKSPAAPEVEEAFSGGNKSHFSTAAETGAAGGRKISPIESEDSDRNNVDINRGVRYNPGLMAAQFGASLDSQGVPVGRLQDADLPDVMMGTRMASKPSEEAAGFAGAYNRNSKAPGIRKGKAISDVDPSMYPFNVVAGSRSGNAIIAGRDDRLSPKDASAKLALILESFGLMAEPHEFCYDFTQAMFVAHALNGASIVGPGRANFFVGGYPYSYGTVIKILGPDARRFFRAYADDIAKAVSKVLESYDPSDHDSVRMCGQIRSIAVVKQIVQFPYLIHDSADACVKLSPAEIAAVNRSKGLVLNDTPNAVDSLNEAGVYKQSKN